MGSITQNTSAEATALEILKVRLQRSHENLLFQEAVNEDN